MTIRLLKKSEIDKIKSQERKRELDSGLTLAKRIDSLREIHAEEEKSLLNFRNKTVAEIQKEINKKIQERDSISLQVNEKKELLQELIQKINKTKETLSLI